jgi:hypothetical protein
LVIELTEKVNPGSQKRHVLCLERFSAQATPLWGRPKKVNETHTNTHKHTQTHTNTHKHTQSRGMSSSYDCV